ncbi:TRAP transporter small permease [Neptunomonas sp.]|uniref:TRAP transporter small permease n=1 Tax=Neptunomonas sp. TaxID=1971898 RepID=UPI003565FC25
MRTLPKSIHRLASALSVVAGIFLIVVIGLTVTDVVFRNVFGKSILGTVDISSLLLVAIAFLGLSSAEVDDRHVSVNLLEMKFTHRTRCVLSVVRTVLFVVIAIVVVWGLADALASAMERQETTNGILRLPTWPTKLVLLISFVCYFFVLIWKSINDFSDIRDGTEQENLDETSDSILVQPEQVLDPDFLTHRKGARSS